MTLLSIYIASAVLGLGITVIDMLGLFGNESEDADFETGEDLGDDIGDDFDSEADISGDEGDAADFEDLSGDDPAQPSALGHDSEADPSKRHKRRKRDITLTVLSGARSVVYFALGFGPAGLFALSQVSAPRSLAWSIPAGVAVLIGGRLLRKVLRRELDSQISTEELLLEAGEVIVSIAPGSMGKVRIKYGGSYVDRYARAADPNTRIALGTLVRVADISDECVYVEPDDSITRFPEEQ
jgi:membrane protein implicated in regulation of membrane protease activity